MRLQLQCLFALALFSLFDMFLQVNKIVQLATPQISFANSNFGYSVIKTRWEVEINHDVDVMTDLNLRIVFPFAVPTLIDVGWTPIEQLCEKIRQLNTSRSTVVSGDDAGAHFVVLKNANFKKIG